MKRVAAISFPSKGVAGKTGVWRIRNPILDRQKCVKCLICWIYCPEGTILRKEDDSIEIDYEYCKGCGVCANECPARAIMMVEE
ncbi:MAG: 4Fe-4S binding protein [Nitrososphaeria archaeon]